MTYIDTNVLVYNSVNIDKGKSEKSHTILRNLIVKAYLFISSLTIQEYIFSLSKLKVPAKTINKFVKYYFQFVKTDVSRDILNETLNLLEKAPFHSQINDIIHLKMAEKYSTKLITYDTFFKQLKNYSTIEIEIL